jgi:hypothetical protein
MVVRIVAGFLGEFMFHEPLLMPKLTGSIKNRVGLAFYVIGIHVPVI